ncbi:MAG: hypothetical protein AAGD04_01650 [Pseudomonadota bacterium]
MNQGRLDALLEAERREILPEKFVAPLAEARRRGLVPTTTGTTPAKTSVLEQAGNGINEGLAAVLGAPVDLATAGINLGTAGINHLTGADIPKIQDPVGGSTTFETLLGETGSITPAQPQSGLQRYARSIGREVGALALPGGTAVAKANRVVPAVGSLAASAGGAGVGSQVGRATYQAETPLQRP